MYGYMAEYVKLYSARSQELASFMAELTDNSLNYFYIYLSINVITITLYFLVTARFTRRVGEARGKYKVHE